MPPPGNPPIATVLLVEDEPAVRHLVALALERSGYRVITAPDGEHAVALFDSHAGTIDLLVTDLRMPQMDGTELVRLLRARAPTLRVLCVSGYPGTGADMTVTEHYLGKPFSKSDLLQKIREVLDSPL
jgi:two-component system cell cycle sensor histidine kinase/response regulator CckA